MAGNMKKVSEERRRMMLEDSLIKIVPVIAFPMILSQLVNSFYGIADTYFVSQLGSTATAAIGVNDSLTNFTQAVAQGLGAGAASYVSRLLGARKDKDAHEVASTSLFSTMSIMVLICILGYIFMSPLVDFLGATPTSKHYTMDYARFILLGAPFTGGTFVLSQLLRSEGNTTYSMIGTVSGCVVNIGLDPLFISVFGLEVAGAAIATTISKMISFTILLLPFLRKHTMLELSIKHFKLKWESTKEVVKMGMPTFLKSASMSVASTVTNNVASGFGDYALAAMSVGNKSMKFIESVIMGFSNGIQPIIGFSWGAKKYKRVRESFRFVVVIGMAMSVVLGVIFIFLAPNVIKIFASADDPQIISMGTLVLRSQLVVLTAHMMVMIASGLFQALGRATSATVLALSRSVLLLIPMALILPKIFDVNGLACSRAAADTGAFLFIALPLILKFLKDLKRAEQEELETK